jgi:hypothetical protein
MTYIYFLVVEVGEKTKRKLENYVRQPIRY